MHSSLVTDLQQRLAACKGASVVYCLRSSCSTYSQRYDRISHSTWVFLDPEYVGPTLDRLDRGMQLEPNGKYFRQSHHANLPIDLQQVHRPWSEKILQRHSPMMMDVMLHGTRQHERCFNTCNTNIDELLVLDAAHQLTGTGNQHW